MSRQQVTSLLDRLQITLEPELTSDILAFLPTLPPSDGQAQWPMRAIAAAAVRADAAQVGSVGGEGRVSYGAPMEQFLRHVDREDKLRFLEEVGRIFADWKQAPGNLTGKFMEVRRTYRIFLHFRTLFRTLAATAALDAPVAYRAMAAFWIVFLRAKALLACKCKLGGEAIELELLLTVVGFAFKHMAVGVDEQAADSAFCCEFEQNIVVAKQLREYYEKQFWEILEKPYGVRNGPEGEMDLRELVQNEDLLRRFVDSFTISFEREKGANFDEVNELYYLELDLPPLTPNPQQHSTTQSPHNDYQISKVLTYDDPEESDEHSHNHSDPGETPSKNTPNAFTKPLQNSEHPNPNHGVDQIFRHFLVEQEEGYAEVQRRRKKFVINKCQTRLFILKWVQDEIRASERFAEGLILDMREVVDVRRYEELRSEKIMELLEKVCSACKDKLHRSGQVYRLFLAFLQKMRRSVRREDFLSIVSNPQYIDAFLCLTSLIFNFAYKTTELSFQQYCNHFDITILTGFVPLNWLGANAELPKELQLFLFELEERILFDELWRSEAGFQLLRLKSSSNFVEMAIRKRLFKHIAHRIALLCKNDITDKERTALFKFVEEILATRLHLLRKSNLYVIIACSVNYCYGKVLSFGRVLDALRKDEHIARLTYQTWNEFGDPISVEEFYSNVFMMEMEPIMTARKELLLTTPPAKATPSTAVRQNTPLTELKPAIVIRTYNFGEESFSRSEATVGQYRKNLAVKIFEAPCKPYQKSSSSSEGDE